MDGETFRANQPFVVLGYPTETEAKTFGTEEEARAFISDERRSDKFATFARIYGLSGGKWNRL